MVNSLLQTGQICRTLSRALHGAARAALAAASTFVAISDKLDPLPSNAGEIQRLGAEFDTAVAVVRSIRDSASDRVFDAAVDTCSDIVTQIYVAPARSLPDLAIKVRAFIWMNSGDIGWALEQEEGPTDTKFAQAISLDIAALASPPGFRLSSHGRKSA